MSTPIQYDTSRPGIARIVLDRADTRNAQDTAFLYALNEAFDRAAHDDEIKVIVLSANGPHFSSGHDLREVDGHGNMRRHETVTTWGGFGKPGAEAQYAREQEIYVGFCERWRNLPKPTMALVHGKVIAGGLMLVWPCDLVIASDDAEGVDIAWCYTMFVNPLPADLLAMLKTKRLVLVPELNYLGQFASILRVQGVNAQAITQYTGLPFKVSDLKSEIRHRLDTK